MTGYVLFVAVVAIGIAWLGGDVMGIGPGASLPLVTVLRWIGLGLFAASLANIVHDLIDLVVRFNPRAPVSPVIAVIKLIPWIVLCVFGLSATTLASALLTLSNGMPVR